MIKTRLISIVILATAFTLTVGCGQKSEEKKLALKNEIQTLENELKSFSMKNQAFKIGIDTTGWGSKNPEVTVLKKIYESRTKDEKKKMNEIHKKIDSIKAMLDSIEKPEKEQMKIVARKEREKALEKIEQIQKMPFDEQQKIKQEELCKLTEIINNGRNENEYLMSCIKGDSIEVRENGVIITKQKRKLHPIEEKSLREEEISYSQALQFKTIKQKIDTLQELKEYWEKTIERNPENTLNMYTKERIKIVNKIIDSLKATK